MCIYLSIRIFGHQGLCLHNTCFTNKKVNYSLSNDEEVQKAYYDGGWTHSNDADPDDTLDWLGADVRWEDKGWLFKSLR